MTIYMLVMTIIIAAYLASILVVEYYVGLKELFDDFYSFLEKDNGESKESREAWDSMPEGVKKGIAATILLAIMPVLGVKLLLNI